MPATDEACRVVLGITGMACDHATASQTAGKGSTAIGQLVNIAPYVLAAELTLADIVLYHCLRTTAIMAYNWHIHNTVSALQAWQEMMAAQPITAGLDAAAEQLPAYIRYLQNK